MPGWHQLFFEDVTLAETLHEAGYATALIADILHFTRPGRNFHRGYRYYDWVRGHSFDYYATLPHQLPEITCWSRSLSGKLPAPFPRPT